MHRLLSTAAPLPPAPPIEADPYAEGYAAGRLEERAAVVAWLRAAPASLTHGETMPIVKNPHQDLYAVVRQTRTAIAFAKAQALDHLLDDLEHLAGEWAGEPEWEPTTEPAPKPATPTLKD